MTLSQKIRSAFAIITVFILVISTNQLDKKYYKSIKRTMKSIFEDRLVAKGYLYDLNTLFYKKHIEAIENKDYQPSKFKNEKINELIKQFGETKLTSQEESRFNGFKKRWESLMEFEERTFNVEEVNEDLINEYCERIVEIEDNLNELANIQLGEGESMIKSAQLFTEKNEFLGQIELIFIIALGLAIQFLIFYKFKS